MNLRYNHPKRVFESVARARIPVNHVCILANRALVGFPPPNFPIKIGSASADEGEPAPGRGNCAVSGHGNSWAGLIFSDFAYALYYFLHPGVIHPVCGPGSRT